MSQSHAGGENAARRSVEVEARTVDEAIARGLVRLGGLSRSEVNIEILSEGKGGLLGFGAETARVRISELLPGEEPTHTVPPAAADAPAPGQLPDAATPAGTQELVSVARPSVPRAETTQPRPRSQKAGAGAEAVAREVVETLLTHLGYDAVVLEQSASLLPIQVEDEESLVLTIRGEAGKRLLKEDGRALQALQFLGRLIVGRQVEGWVNLLLDVEGARARRMQELVQLAEQSADLVDREGRPVSLPPMTPYERRVVHLALRDHPNVATQSIGTGDFRKVTVRRKDQLLPEL